MLYPMPTRFVVATMIGLGSLVHAIVRVSLSLAWLVTTTHSSSSPRSVDHAPITGFEQGLVLGVYAFGRLCAVLPLTHWLIARRQGQQNRLAKSGVFYTMLLTAVLMAVQPTLMEQVSGWEAFVWLLIGSRVLIGAFQSSVLPSLLELLASWMPTGEMRPFSLIFVCHNVGSALACMAVACWSLPFYTPSVICVLFAICWIFLVFDAPANHPRITVAERLYIASCGDGLSTDAVDTKSPPASGRVEQFWPALRRVWSSPTFWAVLWLHAGNAWGSYAMLTAMPIFSHVVVGLDVQATASWMAAMYAGRALFNVLFGQVVEQLMAANCIGRTMMRKCACVFSHTLPGIAILTASFCDLRRPIVCLGCIALGFVLNGAVTKSTYDNLQDLAAQHHGALHAMVDCVSSGLGVLCPLVMVMLVGSPEFDELSDWRPFLWIVAGMYIVPSALYMVCGSAAKQPWSRNTAARESDKPEPVMLKIQRKSIHKEMYF